MMTQRQKIDKRRIVAYLAIWDSLLTDNMRQRAMVRWALKASFEAKDRETLQLVAGQMEAFLVAHPEARLTEKEYHIYQNILKILRLSGKMKEKN